MSAVANPDLLTSDVLRALTAGFLIVMMLSLGIEIGGAPRKERAERRHERWLLVRALVVNLVVLPLIAFVIVRGLHRTGVAATAVLLASATPGGRFAPRIAKLAHADLGLAIEITLFLAKLTAFTAPVTIEWLLGAGRVELREIVLVAELLVLQMLPYLAGRWLRRKRPRAAARLTRPLGLAELTFGVAFFAYLLARGHLAELRAVGPADWGAGLLFALVSLSVGWSLGGPAPETRRAFAVTATARNLALGLLVAGELYPGGAVQVALFGIWCVCFAVDAVYAAWMRRPRPQPQLA